MRFTIEHTLQNGMARAGKIETLHGSIETPAFVVVGTKGTVKALTPEQVRSLGAQVVLANTYHLYLEPGEKILSQAGGLHSFMGWDGPTMTDSGGFQAFSLGAGFDRSVGKIGANDLEVPAQTEAALAKIDEDGVSFKSFRDGSPHRFTPEKSMEIQHAIGADILFAFDECTSPAHPHEYQKNAMERTHRWAERSLAFHKKSGKDGVQALFGIVQGGRFEDLRKESARVIGAMDFPGFGIGGSFDEKDMYTAVEWVNRILPEGKPRHLLGIGEPRDLFDAVRNGCDLFDCVAPTRRARNGSLYTSRGILNIFNAEYVSDFTPIEKECGCYTCAHFSRAYLAHLFRSKELLSHTLASIHNVYFIVNLVKKMRTAIFDGTFERMREDFFQMYKV